MTRLLLGIDVGTTGVRVSALDEEGTVVAEEAEACPPEMRIDGGAEADAEAWWRVACALVSRLGSRAHLARIEAVGVSGQAPTAVLVDDDGAVLRPAMLWLDVRAKDEARRLEATLGRARAEAIGGNRVHAYYLGPKLAWLRAHEPETFARASVVLQPHAFVAMRLTGVPSCDLSTAMLCAPLFDARGARWSEEALRAVGARPEAMPKIVRSHDVIGSITGAAAAATGLRAGTPVVAGAGDFAASALAAAALDQGEACLTLGTSGNLTMPFDDPRFDPRLINSHHAGCDRWLALGGTMCGAAIEWFRRATTPDAPWETLEAEAAAVPAGSDGVTMLPYLQGERTPVWDEDARGAFVGLRLAHGRGHMYRALLEGIALGFRASLEIAEEGGLLLERVIAVEGAGASATLRQACADALGVRVTWVRGAGSSAAGAALLAGLGAGVLPNALAARAWLANRIERSAPSEVARHDPDPHAHATLRKRAIERERAHAALRAAERR